MNRPKRIVNLLNKLENKFCNCIVGQQLAGLQGNGHALEYSARNCRLYYRSITQYFNCFIYRLQM